MRFDEAVTAARDAAERIARAEGAHAAADYLAEVTAALGAAGSSAHAWQLASAGLAYAGSSRNEAWAALTLLDLDRKEAADPDHVGLPLHQPRRRQALAVLYRSSRTVSRSVDLARYAVAAIYQRRESVPAEAAGDPTVRLYLLGELRSALPAFEDAAVQARARGELAREVHCRASIARSRAALGELEAARAALAEATPSMTSATAGSAAGPSSSPVEARRERWQQIPGLVTGRERCDAGVMKSDMMLRTGTGSAVSREVTAEPGEPGWWRRVWRRLMPPPSAELILAQLNGQLAVLEGARAELEAGWVQGGWWSVTSADGDHRLATGDAGGSPAHIDGACLVGALARAGSSSDVGRAVDAVYDALWASRGQPTPVRRAAAGALARGPAGPGAHAHPVERPDRANPGRGPGGGRSRDQRHDHGPDVRAAASSPSRRAAGRPR